VNRRKRQPRPLHPPAVGTEPNLGRTATGRVTTGSETVPSGSVRGMNAAAGTAAIGLVRRGIGRLAGMSLAETAAAKTGIEIEIEIAVLVTVIVAVETEAVVTGAVGMTTNGNPSVARDEKKTVEIGAARMSAVAQPSATIDERETKRGLELPLKMAKVPPTPCYRSKMGHATATGHHTMAEMIGGEMMTIIGAVTTFTAMTEGKEMIETGVAETMKGEAVDARMNGVVGAVEDPLTVQAALVLARLDLVPAIDLHLSKAEGMTTIEAVVADTETIVIAETEIEMTGIGAGAKIF
jgi:hypothetical protein